MTLSRKPLTGYWWIKFIVYFFKKKKKKHYLQDQEFQKDYFLENTLESLEWEMLFWGEEWDEERRGLR